MKIISAGIQRPAVIILALTSFLLLSAFQAFAQDNSRASFPKGSIQKGNDHTFSHDLNAETITFEAVNPSTKVAGLMTVTISGAFRGNRLWDGESPAGSHLQANEQASFSFVPYDRYSPSYSAAARPLQIAGDTTNDSILLDFGLMTTSADGSSQRFTLRELVTVTEDGAQVTFWQLNTQK